MPISLNDIQKLKAKHHPGTSMGVIQPPSGCSQANLNFFAKPSPKFQDDDIIVNNFNLKAKNDNDASKEFDQSHLMGANAGARKNVRPASS